MSRLSWVLPVALVVAACGGQSEAEPGDPSGTATGGARVTASGMGGRLARGGSPATGLGGVNDPAEGSGGSLPVGSGGMTLRPLDGGSGGPGLSSDGGLGLGGSADAGVTVGYVVDPASPVLPVLMIDVAPVAPDRIAAVAATTKTRGKLKLYVGHRGAGTAAQLLADLGARTPVLETPIGIKVRGKVSSGFPKKPYSLDLLDDKGMERGVPFLGMPKDADWVLHPCFNDVTCVRNALIYDLARGTGRYSVRSQHVEVFLNGMYWGQYLVVEKPKFDDSRIPLKKPTAADVTGGYLIRNEFLGNGKPTDMIPQDFVSKELPLIYSYAVPSAEEISAEQKTYIQGFMNKFDALARSPDFNDPTAGYPKILDVPSWVDFALFQELTNNIDAYMKSIYMQKAPDAQGGKLALGPIWDFDFALGNVDFRDAQKTNVWAYTLNRFGGEKGAYTPPGIVPYVPMYWEKLWKDPPFLKAIKCRWSDLRKVGGALNAAAITKRLDLLVARLAFSEPRDHVRWPTINNTTMTGPCCGIKAFPTYKGYIDYLRTFLTMRTAFMDANLPGTCP